MSSRPRQEEPRQDGKFKAVRLTSNYIANASANNVGWLCTAFRKMTEEDRKMTHTTGGQLLFEELCDDSNSSGVRQQNCLA